MVQDRSNNTESRGSISSLHDFRNFNFFDQIFYKTSNFWTQASSPDHPHQRDGCVHEHASLAGNPGGVKFWFFIKNDFRVFEFFYYEKIEWTKLSFVTGIKIANEKINSQQIHTTKEAIVITIYMV